MESEDYSNYLYIFLHIPRTAGTTFVAHIEENFKEDERLRLYTDSIDFPKRKLKKSYNDYLKIVGDKIKNTSLDKREKIKIIYGHHVPYDIHKFFKKPARYVTFVREPLKRTISLYNFFRETYENRLPKSKNEEIFKRVILRDGKLISFNEWLNKKYNKGIYGNSSDSQVKFLKSLGYLKGKEVGKKEIANLLQKFYFIGTTENYDKDVLFLYHKLGINKYFIRQNVSRFQKGIKKTDEMHSVVSKANQDDELLYSEAKKQSKDFMEKYKMYKLITIYIFVKRLLFLPFTQIYYRPIKTVSRFSRYLKRRSKVYTYCFNLLKEVFTQAQQDNRL